MKKKFKIKTNFQQALTLNKEELNIIKGGKQCEDGTCGINDGTGDIDPSIYGKVGTVCTNDIQCSIDDSLSG
ncbi:MAG TPA: hypothetical protein DCS93_09410 [Microscillaceae bacterium]|nr:hypothetical protein [Microscillaceae bacterium]